MWEAGRRSSLEAETGSSPSPCLHLSGLKGGDVSERDRGPGLRNGRVSPAPGGLPTDAHLSLLMASSAFLPSKTGQGRMRVAPCIMLTIVPPTEPRQWYRGLGRMIRKFSAVWSRR